MLVYDIGAAVVPGLPGSATIKATALVAGAVKTACAGSGLANGLPIIAGVVKGGTGKNIVGTTFNEVRPTQEFVNPEKVADYAKKLQAGEKVSPVEIVDIEGKGKYLTEGHHRYVASQQTGIPVDTVVKKGNGPVGLPDWLEVTWKKYINEDQFWGD